jgi:hypothetical protein
MHSQAGESLTAALCCAAAEHGGGIEIAWVVDDRNQANVNITNMAGVQDSNFYFLEFSLVSFG